MADRSGSTYTYLGPASHLLLEDGGTVYHPGDKVPIDETRAKGMMVLGHMWQEFLPKSGEPNPVIATPDVAPSWTTTVPTGDDGAPRTDYAPGKAEPVKPTAKDAPVQPMVLTPPAPVPSSTVAWSPPSPPAQQP